MITLSSNADACAAVRLAKNLRNSGDAHTSDHVFLNADLTPEQRKLDYDLRSKLKQRRGAGEQDLVIRKGRLHTEPHQSAIVAAQRASASDPSD